MILWFNQLCLLAQAPGQGQGEGGNPLMWMIPALVIFFLFQLFFASNPQKREAKRIEELKSTLKKNDPVVTAGGIMGTVAIVSPERNEVTIKVDDNTRLRVQMRSVYAIPKDEGKTSAKTEPAKTETKTEPTSNESK